MKRFIIIATALILCLFSLSSCFLMNKEEPPVDGGNQNDQTGNTQDESIYWGKVSGVVTENDKPLEGVKVTAGSQSVTTDKNGKYSIEIYSDGATVSFEKEGCITQKKTFKSSSFYRDEINYDLIMFLSVKVYGKVVDGSSSPVSGAIVTIGNQSVTTDGDGYYEFESVIGTSMVIIVTSGNKTARGAVFADEMREGEVEADDIIIK